MPVITLPDGSQRHFEQAVTVRQVAESIGAGLAKAALAAMRGTYAASDTDIDLMLSFLDAAERGIVR